MKRSGLTVYLLTPRPCAHEAAGQPHDTRKELVECVLANGSPGFSLRRQGRSPRRVLQRRSRWRRRADLVDAWGGYCGAGAPPGVGCGANGRTPLEFAHLRPTGLDGRSRGWERRHADVKAHPFDYCLLCRDCHREFDARGAT